MQSQTSIIFPILRINGQTKEITLGSYTTTFVPGKIIEVPINPLDLILSQQDGFEGLIDEIRAIGKLHHFELKSVLELVADSPNIRSKYFQQFMGLPKYVADKIIELLVKRKACGIYNSGVRKYEDFAVYLQQRVVGKTVRSLEAPTTNQFRYTLPLRSELAEMSEEMLLEEIRVCDASRSKHKKDDLAILRSMLTNKRKEETEHKPQQSEVEFLKAIAREDSGDEDEQEQKIQRKKKQKQKQKQKQQRKTTTLRRK